MKHKGDTFVIKRPKEVRIESANNGFIVHTYNGNYNSDIRPTVATSLNQATKIAKDVLTTKK
jgi:hypothetical protein